MSFLVHHNAYLSSLTKHFRRQQWYCVIFFQSFINRQIVNLCRAGCGACRDSYGLRTVSGRASNIRRHSVGTLLGSCLDVVSSDRLRNPWLEATTVGHYHPSGVVYCSHMVFRSIRCDVLALIFIYLWLTEMLRIIFDVDTNQGLMDYWNLAFRKIVALLPACQLLYFHIFWRSTQGFLKPDSSIVLCMNVVLNELRYCKWVCCGKSDG